MSRKSGALAWPLAASKRAFAKTLKDPSDDAAILWLSDRWFE